MSADASMKLVILYDDEIRIAARAVRNVQGALSNTDCDDNEKSRLLTTAIRACLVALGGAERDDVSLVLARKELFFKLDKEPT